MERNKEIRVQNTGKLIIVAHLFTINPLLFTFRYNEIKDYSFTTHKSTNGKAIGHFTQMVWKGSRKVGYGYAAQQHPNYPTNRIIIIVAKYSPAGNVMTRYGQNVMPLK